MLKISDILCRSSSGSTLTILAYHRITSDPGYYYANAHSVRQFSAQLAALRKVVHFRPLGEALDELRNGRPVRHMCSLTFDDGYKDNLENALPVLLKEKVNATVFVATSFLDGSRFFCDQVSEAIRLTNFSSFDGRHLGLPHVDLTSKDARKNSSKLIEEILKYRPLEERNELAARICRELNVENFPRLLMNEDEVLRLHKSKVEIGAHGHDHLIFSSVSDATLAADLRKNVERLQAITGVKPSAFAYPNGKVGADFRIDQKQILVANEIKYAVTTNPGLVRQRDDIFSLKRFNPWGTHASLIAVRMMREIGLYGATNRK